MNHIKEKKIINKKIYFGVFILIFFGLIVVFGNLKNKDNNQNLDNKLAVVASNGIALVSISNERRMINELTFDQNIKVWIPGDGNWVKNNEVKINFDRNKKLDFVKNIFWYNFGFYPDKILILDSVDQWKEDSILINNLGFVDWFKYRINYGKMLFKREKINDELNKEELVLDEIMVRDFSESRINNEELRLSVFNNTNQSGLADFMTKRLEWSGFSVVSTDNSMDKINKCLIVYGNKTDLNYGWKMINIIFDCDKKFNENLNENELEIYFGDNLASMIKYSSYFK